AGGRSGCSTGVPAHSPAAMAAASVATSPPAAGRAPRASYSIRLPPAKVTTASARPTMAGRSRPPARRIISRDKAAISSPVVHQRRSLHCVGGYHLAHEHGMVPSLGPARQAAVHPRQRLVEHRRAGALLAKGHAGELLIRLARGKAARQRFAPALGQ